MYKWMSIIIKLVVVTNPRQFKFMVDPDAFKQSPIVIRWPASNEADIYHLGLLFFSTGVGFRVIRGDFVPVYVALGMIMLSMSFGLNCAKQQLLYAPNVFVSKKKRETFPEVNDPDYVVDEADKFITKSFFRRIAHVQEFDKDKVMSNPISGDALKR